ncbi:hypothetical protein [Leifsonia sp. TF02-11]|uniref:hypothetical protein n=1 Tax=Leifsonia sp. TF02-11 TaxID=2815212 RepID=UPI001AA0F7C4|nr:hypothetical protein [Leifsonia sp. TF02-11]MBO1739688.1 hypothetical protein [Leifsonia sp. TF02-11]
MKHQDIAIERYTTDAAYPYRRVRIWLTERRGGRWGQVVRTRQISLDEDALKAALREAGLWERVEVTRQEKTTVEADVAMYAALSQLSLTTRGEQAKKTLWERLVKRMGI